MEGDSTKDIISELTPSAIEYIEFMNCELEETVGASFFQVHHAAPDDMTYEQLEVMAAEFRATGWNAQVASTTQENDGPFGIRIISDE